MNCWVPFYTGKTITTTKKTRILIAVTLCLPGIWPCPVGIQVPHVCAQNLVPWVSCLVLALLDVAFETWTPVYELLFFYSFTASFFPKTQYRLISQVRATSEPMFLLPACNLNGKLWSPQWSRSQACALWLRHPLTTFWSWQSLHWI